MEIFPLDGQFSTGEKWKIFYWKKRDNFRQKPLLLEKSGKISTEKKWTIFAKKWKFSSKVCIKVEICLRNLKVFFLHGEGKVP